MRSLHLPPDEALHVVVDGGVDDALALAVLIGSNIPIAQVVATEGSCPLEQTAATTARLMASIGSAVPVRLGAEVSLSGPYPAGRDPFHGEDCFAGRCDLLRQTEPPQDRWDVLDGPVLATGALTAVATAVAAGQTVGEITWMGGSIAHGGNMTPAAEFNAWMDPTATDRLFRSGHLKRMVPLDITMQFSWGEKEIDALIGGSSAGALIGTAAQEMCTRDGAFIPHDAIAAAAVLNPDLFEWVSRHVRCETAGRITNGATVVDRRPGGTIGTTLVAEDVSVGEVTRLILDAVTGIPPA